MSNFVAQNSTTFCICFQFYSVFIDFGTYQAKLYKIVSFHRDMLDSLITSKTRIKLLLKFFLNTSTHAYLRGLADEFGESTNALRLELNHLENAGLLKSESKGNKKVYQANSGHPLFKDIHSLVLKHSGISQVIEEVVERVGDISQVWVRGDFAVGKDSGLINLVIAGKDIDTGYFEYLIQKAEELIKRRISYIIISPEKEAEYSMTDENKLLVWTK